MAYAELADVLARAGRLAPTWDVSTSPGYADIERFLDDVAGEINATVGSFGLPTPVVDATAAAGLRGLNADGALALALRGTFPSQEGPAAVKVLLGDCEGRYDAGMKALVASTHPVLTFLLSAAGQAGADDFWSTNPDYRQNLSFQDLQGYNPFLQPTVERGDGF